MDREKLQSPRLREVAMNATELMKPLIFDVNQILVEGTNIRLLYDEPCGITDDVSCPEGQVVDQSQRYDFRVQRAVGSSNKTYLNFLLARKTGQNWQEKLIDIRDIEVVEEEPRTGLIFANTDIGRQPSSPDYPEHMY